MRTEEWRGIDLSWLGASGDGDGYAWAMLYPVVWLWPR